MMTPESIAAAVAEGAQLQDEIAARKERFEQIRAELAQLAPGEYTAPNGRRAQVVCPKPAIRPGPEQITRARQELDPPEFEKLFFHTKLWKPVEDFRAKASVLLSKAKFNKIVALFEKPAVPYVTFK